MTFAILACESTPILSVCREMKKTSVFGDSAKLAFLDANGLLDDPAECVRVGRRGNTELRSKKESQVAETEKVKCLSANISFQCT